jgi:thioredoxin reductase (NADPH)
MNYDVIIVGAGPAGLTSAIYLLRAGKKVLILEKETIGGQISSSPLVENYPGFSAISGSTLADNLYNQILNLGGDIELEEVLKIEDKKVTTDESVYNAKAIILALGVKPRLLGLDREEDFIGNGISFCVSCDGAFYKNKTVAVIGGGNSAIGNALYLKDICKKVYLIQNLDKLTCEDILIPKLKSENLEILFNSKVDELIGQDSLETIVVNNNEIKVDGIFISIGQIPNTKIANLLDKDHDYILKDDDCATNVEGVFAAGDCTSKKIRQLTTATSDGTIAAISVINYLR